MIDTKRLLDIAFSALLLGLLAPLIAVLILWLLVRQGRPVFFVSDRMRTTTRHFRLIKFRTMTHSDKDAGVSGGDKRSRITQTGKWLRRTRLDELPQLWNILRGDMSFVGPRPPLPIYVQAFPDLYAKILSVKPGVTGLATLAYRRREASLLAGCRSASETHAVDASRCSPQKARLDHHYIRTRTLGRDMLLVFQTIGDLVRRV